MPAASWTPNLLTELTTRTGVAVRQDAGSTSAAASDFGRLTRGEVAAVATPRDLDELEAVLRFANQHGLPLTTRAGGNSQSGQSIPRSGLSLAVERLDRVADVETGKLEIECEAGARWRSVVAKCAAHGLLPVSMPLNLDLSVGGTLSAGGFGATSHRFGPSVSHVRELTGVSGGGVRIRASGTSEAEFFHALLSGVGRAGVIAKVRLDLRRVRPRVSTFFFQYQELSSWLSEQTALAASADYLEAFCAGSVMGLRKLGARRVPFARWSYGLQVSFEHEPGEPPDRASVEARCASGRLLHVEEDDTIAFASRYDSRFAFMRKTGAWELYHPWLEISVPLARVEELLARALDQVPVFVADGMRVNLLATGALPPFFMVPSGDPVVTLALLPAGIPAGLRDDALAAVGALHDSLVAEGGKRYLSGWLGMMDEAGWRRHYADRYDAWVAAKRRFDPKGVLSSLLFPNA